MPANNQSRRWLQFRLGTLMIVVTLFCLCGGGYIRWEQGLASQRGSAIKKILAAQAYTVERQDDDDAIPWIRQLLGDRAWKEIVLPTSTNQNELAKWRTLFPEALVRTDPQLDPF